MKDGCTICGIRVTWGVLAHALAVFCYGALTFYIAARLIQDNGTKVDASYAFNDYHGDVMEGSYITTLARSTSIAEVATLFAAVVLAVHHLLSMTMGEKPMPMLAYTHAVAVPLLVTTACIWARISDVEKVVLLVVASFANELLAVVEESQPEQAQPLLNAAPDKAAPHITAALDRARMRLWPAHGALVLAMLVVLTTNFAWQYTHHNLSDLTAAAIGIFVIAFTLRLVLFLGRPHWYSLFSMTTVALMAGASALSLADSKNH